MRPSKCCIFRVERDIAKGFRATIDLLVVKFFGLGKGDFGETFRDDGL